MKIFVTGGTGFIGKSVVSNLISQNHKLLILSRKPPVAKSHSFKLYIKDDLSNIKTWTTAVKKFKPDAAIHLAWEGVPDYSLNTSIRNLIYGLDLISMLAKIKCKKIVCSGSCWEYGAESGKLSEDDCCNPLAVFAAAKLGLYFLGKAIAEEHRVQFIWTRLFFVYGPGQKKSSLIPYLINCKTNKKRPKVTNPYGSNDFVFVDDVAKALTMIISKNIHARNAVYNIGSGKLTSVQKVKNIIYDKQLNTKIFKNGFFANISRIKQEIGWKPTTSITQGIKKTMESYQNG